MHISVAVAKINKWAVLESGDTLEVIERPHGGLSVVLADGQSSGLGAKSVSLAVVRKVVSELGEGVRDGPAARAANDMLHTLRGGKVSATLVVLSVDMHSHSLVITRCGGPPVYVREPEGTWRALPDTALTLGFRRQMRPSVENIPLAPGLVVCAFTDGLAHAGSRKGAQLDVAAAIAELWAAQPTAQALADGLLARGLAADDNRPTDDTSIAVLHIAPGAGDGPRYMRIEMPLSEV